MRNDPVEYLERFVFRQGNQSACGFKFKYEEMTNPCFSTAFSYVLRNDDIKIIHMKRKNKWKRFLSEYVALNITKQFNSTDKAIEVPDVRIELKPEVIEKALDWTSAMELKFDALFSKHKKMDTYYEDFMADAPGRFAEVTSFLDVPGDFEFQPRTKKISRKLKDEEFLTNYAEIIKYFRKSKYASHFEE